MVCYSTELENECPDGWAGKSVSCLSVSDVILEVLIWTSLQLYPMWRPGPRASHARMALPHRVYSRCTEYCVTGGERQGLGRAGEAAGYARRVERLEGVVEEMRREYVQLEAANDEVCGRYQEAYDRERANKDRLTEIYEQLRDKLSVHGDVENLLDQLDALNNTVYRQGAIIDDNKRELQERDQKIERMERRIGEYRRLLESRGVGRESVMRIDEMLEQIASLKAQLAARPR